MNNLHLSPPSKETNKSLQSCEQNETNNNIAFNTLAYVTGPRSCLIIHKAVFHWAGRMLECPFLHLERFLTLCLPCSGAAAFIDWSSYSSLNKLERFFNENWVHANSHVSRGNHLDFLFFSFCLISVPSIISSKSTCKLNLEATATCFFLIIRYWKNLILLSALHLGKQRRKKIFVFS